jgi:hypothetical protein
MLSAVVVRIVHFCARHGRSVVLIACLLTILAGLYDALAFSINADADSLIAQNLPWHERQVELSKAFPQKGMLAVVRAPTAEGAEQATNQLAQDLSKRADLFGEVGQPDSGGFFERNGLLFRPASDVAKLLDGLVRLGPFIRGLAGDPTLRGVMKTFASAANGVRAGQLKLEQLSWPLSLAEASLKKIMSGKTTVFSWQELVSGAPLAPAQLRHFIELDPKLNFSTLKPGQKATEGVHRAAGELNLLQNFGASVELTGKVPMNDDQFSVIRASALRDTSTAVIGVLIVLWLALRSWKLIVAVFFSLAVGLALTAGIGLALVGSFNLISIAFFVLFVGLGVDFGIQFSVRYRTERHEQQDLFQALDSTARKIAMPLSLAAAATALGFLSFLPTSYSGLGELGLIAGCGMIVAFICSITIVPAVLALVNPPGEREPVGFRALAPLDAFMQRYRIAIISVTLIAVLAGMPLLFDIRFDFNPVNLQSPNSPSVRTYKELQTTAESAGNDAEILAPSLQDADAIAKRVSALPEVSQALTANSLLPDQQQQKVALIRKAKPRLDPVLSAEHQAPSPSAQETIEAINAAADDLAAAAGNSKGVVADSARRVSGLLRELAKADAAAMARAEAAVAPSLKFDLSMIKASLGPDEPITIDSLPPDLRRGWVLPDGRTRVQVIPKGDPNDTDDLRSFARAVLAAEPTASGPAVSYYESGRTITRALVEAGALALASVFVLLLITLRRLGDVLLTLVPLLIAGAVALEVCVLSDFPLNFANVIALPLLLGVGVAFKIYYILAWRAGKTGLLQSTLTRAVVFSAMTNAISFGSMSISSYPGMSSMGQLMILSLLCTMAAAVFFQPVLMGKPRKIKQRATSAKGKLSGAVSNRGSVRPR